VREDASDDDRQHERTRRETRDEEPRRANEARHDEVRHAQQKRGGTDEPQEAKEPAIADAPALGSVDGRPVGALALRFHLSVP
jgi:hypothetical protein